jgi:Outer membrane receptor proteins, mostly Fe transport
LPNLDFSLDFNDEMKGRASFSKTIARAPMGNLYAGPTPRAPTGSVLVAESMRGAGDSQNPALKPLESNNIDVAFEWYFAKSSYASLTLWGKRVDNFVGNTVVQESLYGLRDPTSGPDAQKVLDFLRSSACIAQVTAAGNDPARCSANNVALFTGLAMLRNAAATGGLSKVNGRHGQWQQMATAYDLIGNPDDPLYTFNVNTPINQHKANLHGFELGSQYFFGESGFGVQANYTKVMGDVSVNNFAQPGVNQFALTGLSDTANAVLMYEKYGWSARLAWNWRDKYLIAAEPRGVQYQPVLRRAVPSAGPERELRAQRPLVVLLRGDQPDRRGHPLELPHHADDRQAARPESALPDWGTLQVLNVACPLPRGKLCVAQSFPVIPPRRECRIAACGRDRFVERSPDLVDCWKHHGPIRSAEQCDA